MSTKMDFKQLKTFITICDVKSFTSAATTLGYAQSTITTQIKMLEDDLGTTLFNRIGKTISLTNEGQKLLPYARQVLDLERSIYNNVSASSNSTGNLVIGTPESLCNQLVPQIIKFFKSRYPQVNIEIKLATTKKLPLMIKNNEVDLAFIIGTPHKTSDLKCVFIAEEKMCFLASCTHELAQTNNLTLKDIIQYPLILTSKECEYRSALMEQLDKNKLDSHIALETSNISAIKTFVANELGIAFLPYVSVDDAIQSSTIKVLNFDTSSFHISSQLIYHKDKNIFPLMQQFIDTVKEFQLR